MLESIVFKTERKLSRFLDPRRDFQPLEHPSEIRYDPLTGLSSRICHFARATAPPMDLAPIVERSLSSCPFCPQVVMKLATRYEDRLVPGGLLSRGGALLFPNLFPYDEVSAVAVMCREHYFPLAELPARVLEDGVGVARDFLRLPALRDEVGGDVAYPIVAWNYTTVAGGSMIHPHMQVILSSNPGNALRRELAAEQAYKERHGRVFREDLLEAERRCGERWIGESGSVCWHVPFAPSALLGDVAAVFPGRAIFQDLTDRDIADFAEGLTRVLGYFTTLNIQGFNLMFFSDACGAVPDRHWLTVKVLPRFLISPKLLVQDTSYVQLLLEDRFAMVFPEEVAGKLREFWNAQPGQRAAQG